MVEGAGEEGRSLTEKTRLERVFVWKERGMLRRIITKALGEPSEVGYHRWGMAPSSKTGEFYPAVHREGP